MVAAAAGLPWLLFGLVAGVVVDRIERARAMALLQVARGALTVVLVVGVTTGGLSIALLAAFVFLLGSCEVVVDVASHAILPALVGRDRLQWANSRLITAEVVTFEFVGPALGGVLFAVSVAGPFVLDAASFLVSGVMLLSVARRLRGTGTVARSDHVGPASLGVEVVEGLRWFRSQPLLRSLTAITVSVNLAAGGFYAVLALFAREELRLGPTGYGLLVAASALGSVAAGLTGTRVGSGAARRQVALLTTPSVCLGFALLAGIPWLPIAVLVMIAFGWAVSLYNIVAVSLRQAITPDAMLGRVTAVHRFLAWGALPVGAVAAGFVGDWLGLRAAIGACAIAAGLGGLSTLPTLVRSAPATFVPEHAR